MFNLLIFATLFAQRNPNGEAAAAAAVGIMGLGMLCYFAFVFGMMLLSLALFALWLWMLVDCIQYEQKMPEPDNQLVLWLLLIILTNWIGAAVYYFARRPYNRSPFHNQQSHPSNDPFRPKGF
ncbi:MAG: PLDc N-terminal domain-containing protein [bacterium]|nr:PLDc N-terminal domain-containing protein [bacterium]